MDLRFSNWSRKKKTWVQVIGALAILGIVGAVFGEEPATSPSSSKEESATTKTAESTISTTTNPPSPARIIRNQVESEAGTKSNLDGYESRVRNVLITDGVVTIEMNGDDNLSSGLVKSTNRRLVLDAISALKKAGVPFESADIFVYFPLVDNLGNVSMNAVLGYSFTVDRINQIQPENVDTKRMDSNFADLGTFIHPAFRW